MSRSLRRALASSDAIRVNAHLPLIQDATELVTPAMAEEMLKKNKRNRPVNWNEVEKLSKIMRAGKWQLHAQGIILDSAGNILTGQTRLWAVVYSDTSVYMRISRGSPTESAFVIDRGRPQSARDLSSRRTDRKHSPTEASIARCVCVLEGITKPTADDISVVLTNKDSALRMIMETAKGTNKTKAAMMILGAICEISEDSDVARRLTRRVQQLSEELEHALLPYFAEKCWNKGVAFGMALEKAKTICLNKKGNH